VNDLRIKTGLKNRERSDTVLEQAKKQWTEDYKLLDWGPRGLFYEYLEMGNTFIIFTLSAGSNCAVYKYGYPNSLP
jgi:hypothetical protein